MPGMMHQRKDRLLSVRFATTAVKLARHVITTALWELNIGHVNVARNRPVVLTAACVVGVLKDSG